jgi:hypothetical protein
MPSRSSNRAQNTNLLSQGTSRSSQIDSTRSRAPSKPTRYLCSHHTSSTTSNLSSATGRPNSRLPPTQICLLASEHTRPCLATSTHLINNNPEPAIGRPRSNPATSPTLPLPLALLRLLLPRKPCFANPTTLPMGSHLTHSGATPLRRPLDRVAPSMERLKRSTATPSLPWSGMIS